MRFKERMGRLVDSKATNNGSPWTEDEDQVILTWRVGIPALAVELGRTYEATKRRIHLLRKRGRNHLAGAEPTG